MPPLPALPQHHESGLARSSTCCSKSGAPFRCSPRHAAHPSPLSARPQSCIPILTHLLCSPSQAAEALLLPILREVGLDGSIAPTEKGRRAVFMAKKRAWIERLATTRGFSAIGELAIALIKSAHAHSGCPAAASQTRGDADPPFGARHPVAHARRGTAGTAIAATRYARSNRGRRTGVRERAAMPLPACAAAGVRVGPGTGAPEGTADATPTGGELAVRRLSAFL